MIGCSSMSFIVPIRLIGCPSLRFKSTPFTRDEIISENTAELKRSMIHSMMDEEGSGLAAPQIGVNKMVFLSKSLVPSNPERLEPVFFFNPEFIFHSEDHLFSFESCLSIPSYIGKLSRKRIVHMKYLDENAIPKMIKAEGTIAVLLQHEFDHLIGKLWIDHIKNMEKDIFHEKEFDPSTVPDDFFKSSFELLTLE